MEVLIIFNLITKFTQVNKMIAAAALTIMMFMVVYCATARGLGHPILGDIELVQLAMVALIVGALPYAEHEKGHIAIGIIVDHFPIKLQYFLDIIAGLLKTSFSFVVVYTFIIKIDFVEKSLLREVPFYFFKMLLICGFLAWGLESIKHTVESINLFIRKKDDQRAA